MRVVYRPPLDYFYDYYYDYNDYYYDYYFFYYYPHPHYNYY